MLLQFFQICSYIHFVSLRRHHIHMILQNNEAAGWFDQFQDDRYLLSILTRQIDDLHNPGQATDWAGQFSAQEVEAGSGSDCASVEVECCPRRSTSNALHERESHVLRRLPMPLPLVDEPIVDLLWVEASHRCEPHLIFFLSAAQHQARQQL